jgi:hypothetical protein
VNPRAPRPEKTGTRERGSDNDDARANGLKFDIVRYGSKTVLTPLKMGCLRQVLRGKKQHRHADREVSTIVTLHFGDRHFFISVTGARDDRS